MLGRTETVAALLERTDTDVNATADNNDYTPLFTAAANGHLEVVKFLLGRDGIDINATTKEQGALGFGHYTALMAALDQQRLLIAELLIQQEEIDLNVMGHRGTALDIATEDGYLRLARIIREKGGKSYIDWIGNE